MLINNCRLAGYLRFVDRIKIGVPGQVSNPQSPTLHILTVAINYNFGWAVLVIRDQNNTSSIFRPYQPSKLFVWGTLQEFDSD